MVIVHKLKIFFKFKNFRNNDEGVIFWIPNLKCKSRQDPCPSTTGISMKRNSQNIDTPFVFCFSFFQSIIMNKFLTFLTFEKLGQNEASKFRAPELNSVKLKRTRWGLWQKLQIGLGEETVSSFTFTGGYFHKWNSAVFQRVCGWKVIRARMSSSRSSPR